ncbi:hypothetical protein ScPMuIL_010285 [Solemya velum]
MPPDSNTFRQYQLQTVTPQDSDTFQTITPSDSNTFRQFDPFQVFEVNHQSPTKFYVRVIQGYNITKGWVADMVDTPDPYIKLGIRTSPNCIQRTSIINNNVNPVWNEEFTFLLNPEIDNTLEISLIDANYIRDETLSTRSIPLQNRLSGHRVTQRVMFNETSQIDIEMWAEVETETKLRFSLQLCEEEKAFLEQRQQKVLAAMQRLLVENAPKSLSEVPTIGVLGSGGGFRAMTGLCGVFSALVDSEILDMVTYVAGLSGSAWYISQLYSHPEWPTKTPGDLTRELRQNIDSSPFWLLSPSSMYRYTTRIIEKRRQGQPVSFTDFFGHLVGETLLKGRMEAKLTDQRQILKHGDVPLPLYTCLHVKKHVSAMVFHGIWGSAFCIQFKHLLQKNRKVDAIDNIRQEREELAKELMVDLDEQDGENSDSESEEELLTLDKERRNSEIQLQITKKKEKEQSFLSNILEKLFDSSQFFGTIQGRAAMVHNFMRGLSLFSTYPLSPFTALENEDKRESFGEIFEMFPTHMKRLYVVDSGLTFNSPYPLLLRPQRGVNLLLSFDFSARPSDSTPPFKVSRNHLTHVPLV